MNRLGGSLCGFHRINRITMLPYTRVAYEFSAGRVSAPSVTYWGCVMGRAKRLHDLMSKGYFTPGVNDCGQLRDDFKLSYQDTSLQLPPYEYPDIQGNNRVLADTVKVYLNSLTYIGMYSVTESISNNDLLILPVSKNQISLVKVADVDHSVAVSFTATASGGVVEVKGVSGELMTILKTKKLIPGTVRVIFNLGTGAGSKSIVLSDSINTEPKSSKFGEFESNHKVTGKLGVYTDNDDDVTVVSNSLIINYATGSIEGSLKMTHISTFNDISAPVDCSCCFIAIADPVKLTNISKGDYISLGMRGYHSTCGVKIEVKNTDELSYTFESDENFTIDKLKSQYSEPIVPDPGEMVNKHGEFLVTNIDYAGSVISGANIYLSTDTVMDYRPHLAFAHIAKETRARRLDPNGDYEIITEGNIESIGRLTFDPSSFTISTRVRGNHIVEAYADTAREYDDDPGQYPNIDPSVTVPNFISGDLAIEYEEDVAALPAVLERYDDLRNKEGGLVKSIGQYDPRNPLGFAVGFVTKMSTSNFYILSYEDMTNALEILKDHRRIFHIWNVGDNPSEAFANFITTENLPEASRFRIGYQNKTIQTTMVKISEAANYTAVLKTDSETSRRRLESTSVDFRLLGVASGDKYRDSTGKVLTVEFVSIDTITFLERYSRVEDYSNRTMEYNSMESKWEYSFGSGTIKDATAKVKFRYQKGGVTASAELEDGTDIPDWKFDCSGGNAVLEIKDSEIKIVGYPKISAVPEDETVYGFSIIRDLTAAEQVNLLVSQQTSIEPANVIVLSKDIKYFEDGKTSWSGKYLPGYATPGIIFAAKITLLPHMPLTEMFFDTFDGNLGSVMGFGLYLRSDMELLGDAGYCMLNSEQDGKPFCESDFLAGYKLHKESDRGLLSKLTPILLYGKDTYEITKKFKGPMNSGVDDVISLIAVNLMALKERYTTVKYPMLGTLLKNVSTPDVVFEGSFVKISHRISSQDPLRYVDNIIYVE